MIKTLKKIGLFLFLLLPCSSILAAEPPSVIINEIAWMGMEAGWQYEWIELYNPTNQEIDITGWEIENARTKNETLAISTGKIAPNGYFLICRKEIGDCDSINSRMSLHNKYNENGELALKDKQGNTIDQTPAANKAKWPAGNNEADKPTMQRKDPLISGSEPENWQTSQTPDGTPKAKNSQLAVSGTPLTTTPTTTTSEAISEVEPQIIEYPKNIFINEILPSSKGLDAENEWIELYNANGFEVSLAGWQIKDKVGAVRTHTCPTDIKIVPYGFLLVLRTESKITLQNSGDTLELLNPNEEIVHTVNYPKSPLGQSYNRIESGWQWSTVLTPEKENFITQPETAKITETKIQKEPNQKANENTIFETKEKALAHIGQDIPQNSSHLLTFLIALGIAILSGIIVLFLKKKFETE